MRAIRTIAGTSTMVGVNSLLNFLYAFSHHVHKLLKLLSVNLFFMYYSTVIMKN